MAQLELSVVLNLANFRTQLGKLAQASAAYYYPINLTIDKQAFKKQLAALGNIKPVIKIEDSQLDGARARIATLNKSLATLRRVTSTAIEIKVKYKEEGRPAAGTGAVGRAITGRAGGEEALANKSRGELQKLYGLFREANLRVGELSKSLGKSSAEEIRQSLVPAFSDSGEEAVNGLAIGLKDPSSKISKAAKRLTVITIQDVKKGFGIASPSRVFKEIGKDLVAGLEIGFEDFNELKTKMVGKMRQLVSAIKKEVKVGGITMGGLLSPIARPTGASTRTLPGVVSPTRRGESADPGRGNQKILNSLSLLTGNPALYRGRMANLGAERLPSSLLGAAQSQFQLEELAPSFKQARLASGVSPVDKIIDEAFFGRGTLPKAQSALSTLSNSLERLGSTARAALPSGILQSASGNARMRRFGGVAPGESMGIFEPTARPTAYPPSGGFLEFSRRATAISAGLPGNVFGGRGGGASGGGGGGGGRGPGGGGVVPPRGFPVDDVMVTRNAKLGTVLDVAAASTRNFTASQIPLIGGLKNLAGEFGQAAKQVLLYGTAYKGLAFLTSLPGQILNAAKSQQQFTNGLKVATQDTGTFAKELLYVDNVQRAFGLNLETTRTGFTRLYASMAPTGFDSGSIEKLFTGISAATASLQLTPDKAERVIYAFGQMASKGQIMSEEVKGQLGDVLPGALAIFSKAAGMSVKEFSKAMEDGEFVGTRFRGVFAKVADELMSRFGTGAQAAGRSLQGLINTVGGDFTRTLQSFAPLANAAAQATLGPLTGMLREVSMAAQIAMGEQDRVKKQLEAAQADVSALKTGGADAKEIKAAEQNVAALAAQYEVLNEAAKDPAIAQQVKNIEAFVIEIQKAATFTMNLAGVIGNVLSPVFTFLGGNLTSVIGSLALFALGFNAVKLAALLFTGTLATLNAIQKANGSISVMAAAKSTILAGVYRLVGVQATGAQVATVGFSLAVKGLLASTGIGLLVVLLGSVATAFLSVGNKAKEAADRAKRSIDSMVDAARTGNVSLIENELALNRADRQDLENFIKDVEGVTGKKKNVPGGGAVETITLTPAQGREAKRLGAEIGDIVTKESLLSSLKGQRAPLKKVETEGKDKLDFARRRNKQLGLNQPEPTGGDATSSDAGAAKTEKERESRIPQLTLELEKTKELSAVEMQIVNAQLMNNTSQLSSLELLKRLIEFKYEAKSLGLEDLTTEERALKYKEIGLRREQAIFENQLQLQIDLKKERDEIQQGFAATLAGYQEEANFQQMYLDLINQGVLPSLAKVRVEAEKAFAEGEKRLNQSIEQIQLNIAGLELTIEALKLEKNLTPEKQKQLEADEKRLEILKEDLRLRGLLKDTAPERRGAGVAAGERAVAPKTASEYIGEGLEAARDRLAELTNAGYQLVQAANAIGDAFGEAFKGVITGSMTAREALAGFFQSIADHFADMVAQMIAEYLKMALIKGIMSIIGMVAGAAAPGLSSAFGASGPSFNAGAFSGPALSPGAAFGGGGAPDFSGAFGGGGAAFNPSAFSIPAFANGGIVTGPTLGLVGEGRYNEAVIPLPDGKSVPVDLGGMAGGMGGEVTSNIVVNINNGQMQGNGNSNGSELGRKIEGAVKQVLVSELRPGGILSSGRR